VGRVWPPARMRRDPRHGRLTPLHKPPLSVCSPVACPSSGRDLDAKILSVVRPLIAFWKGNKMAPSLVVACKGRMVRRSIQRTLMELGGRMGFTWRFERLCSARLFAVFGADDSDAAEIVATLDRNAGGAGPYLVGQWRQVLSEAEIQQVCAWLDGKSTTTERKA
jgi:hypothetical protein